VIRDGGEDNTGKKAENESFVFVYLYRYLYRHEVGRLEHDIYDGTEYFT